MPVFRSVAVALALVPATATAGTITGRITDQISGAPVHHLTVGAGPVGYGLREYTRADADGRWAIDEPEAGQYNVCFLPDPGQNYLKRCWRDEQVGFYGEPITVPESGVVDGIDTRLAPGTSAAGTVTGWDGQPLAGVCVSAWTPHSGWLRVSDAITAADGSYTLVGLTPGAVNKVVFSPDDGFYKCYGGTHYPGFAEQWFDRQSTIDDAADVTAARSETRAGVDGILGPSAIPPESAEPLPGQCIVPRLRNRTFSAARDALTDAGCSTPMPELRTSHSLKRGRVIASRPAAKTHIRRGRRVRLTVSRGR